MGFGGDPLADEAQVPAQPRVDPRLQGTVAVRLLERLPEQGDGVVPIASDVRGAREALAPPRRSRAFVVEQCPEQLLGTIDSCVGEMSPGQRCGSATDLSPSPGRVSRRACSPSSTADAIAPRAVAAWTPSSSAAARSASGWSVARARWRARSTGSSTRLDTTAVGVLAASRREPLEVHAAARRGWAKRTVIRCDSSTCASRAGCSPFGSTAAHAEAIPGDVAGCGDQVESGSRLLGKAGQPCGHQSVKRVGNG